MPRRRVYLPVTPAGLRSLAQGRELGPAPLLAFAAPVGTAPAVLEDAEHRAWLAAAAAARIDGRRRVIGSVDVDAALVVPFGGADPGPAVGRAGSVGAGRRGTGPFVPDHGVPGQGVASVVEVEAPIPLRRFVSFHVDEEPDGADRDLLWYDVTELADVLALVLR